MNRPAWSLLSFAAASFLATSCGTAYYKAMEVMGYAKRDLLVERVQEARESQAAAKEQIQTTFEAFKSLTGFSGGELETKYESLKDEYENSKSAAEKVSKRITSIDKVAGDMFSEWSDEIAQIQNPNIRGKSEQLKSDTEASYGKVVTSMRAAEQRMPPVLSAFNDHVLFLKHNLNAQAITSLQDEVVKIESNVDDLIRDMQQSIDEADEFLASIQKSTGE